MENNGSERKIICPACGAENNADYAFCLKCGRPLGASAPSGGVPPVWGQPTGDIGGVPEREVYDYVSGNQQVMKKFKRLSSGGTIGWNWPVFILGLFNMQFIWFFYRRMYKLGVLFLALSALIAGISITATVWALESARGTLTQIMQRFFESIELNGDYVISDQAMARLIRQISEAITNAMNNGMVLWIYIAVQLSAFLRFAMLIVTPMFADKAHYNKAMGDLRTINRGNVTTGAVIAAGRPNTAAAVLSGVLFGIAYLMAVTIPVAVLIDGIMSGVSVML